MIETLKDEIPRLMEAAGVPGLGVALIEDGAISWQQGFGVTSTATNEPVTSDTIFEAASLTKPVCAYSALLLCEQGRMQLDAPLATYLPDPYIDDEPRLDRITMRHVLTHTPGFPNWRQDQLLRIYSEPGTRFAYSGEGFVYLQHALEQITGLPLADFVAMTVLGPLGMATSSLVWTEPYATTAAQGHDAEGHPITRDHPTEANAAASLHTTPGEFAQFMLTIMQSPGAPGPLGAASLAEMLRPQIQVNNHPWEADWPADDLMLNQQVAWGLGWGLQHGTHGESFWHWGNNMIFHAYAVGSVERRCGVVLMTNSTNGDKLWAPLASRSMDEDQPALAWLAG